MTTGESRLGATCLDGTGSRTSMAPVVLYTHRFDHVAPSTAR